MGSVVLFLRMLVVLQLNQQLQCNAGIVFEGMYRHLQVG